MLRFPRPGRRFAAFLILAVTSLSAMQSARAHPHVWVSSKTRFLFDAEGNLTGIRHDWTFDKPFSAYVTTGLDANHDGKLTEEELAPLAKENTEGLAEFGYYTKLKIGGKEQAFAASQNYSMSFADGALTQHFDLPLKAPVKAPKIIGIEIYDPEFFVDFSIADAPDAMAMPAGKTGCAINISRPKQATQDDLSKYAEDYFANAGMGLQFANKAVIACP